MENEIKINDEYVIDDRNEKGEYYVKDIANDIMDYLDNKNIWYAIDKSNSDLKYTRTVQPEEYEIVSVKSKKDHPYRGVF